jgi:hypothetical protein
MKSALTLLIVAAFAIAVAGCAKKARADGVTTGDGIPVEVNSADSNTTGL